MQAMLKLFTRLTLPVLSVVTAASAAEPVRISFNKDIRPIMSDTCFRCHGPDKSSRRAGMRLDVREMAVKALPDGKIPIVPGQPDQSEVVRRVFAPNPAVRMPPVSAHKLLSDAQKETIRRWIGEGAVYEGHWAYQPVKRPPVPVIAQARAPIRNPIDNFIQDRLAKENLPPSGEADRRTLIRRVSLDLTGLLPTPEQVQAFQNDSASNAYEKVVDRLLSSPAYAEQQTMHWLDAVRYADTCGFHGDNLFPAWPYRDYVLRSFRDNKSFQQFTVEQLAGDLLPAATIDQRVASAYNRLNRTSAEGGIQPKEYLAKYGADRVRTLSNVWLGSTMGCAECHDHKFDPFLTKDFYSMKAFFADITETGLVPDFGDKAWGTQLELATPEQAARRDALNSQIAGIKAQMTAKLQQAPIGSPQQEQALLKRWEAGELAWNFQHPEAASALHGTTLTINNERPASTPARGAKDGDAQAQRRPFQEGLLVADGPNPDNETFVVTLRPGSGSWTALGISVVEDESLPGNGLARGADRFVLTGVEAELEQSKRKSRQLHFVLATSTEPHNNGMPAAAVLDGNSETGWGTLRGEATNQFLALRFSERITTGPESRILVRLQQDSTEWRRAVIGRFRLALSSAEYSWPANGEAAMSDDKNKDKDQARNWASGLSLDTIAALKTVPDKRTDVQKNALRDYFEWAAPALMQLRSQLDNLEAQRNILNASITWVVTTVATTPRETRILPRGNWMDDSAPVVEPAVPERFGKLDLGGRRANRLDLATWLVSDQNPLTARAFVNRTWRTFFGTGFSKVLDDLGSQGEWPTHPELLDWLASEFMHPEWDAAGTHAWDVKHLIRTIVLSHTYRQSSETNPQIEQKDPEDRLLTRQAHFRIDAENVRDIALEVSGLLQNHFGGPSVRPYQPDGYLAALNFPRREYSSSRGGDLYRRGLYTEWRRSFLHPSLLAFDAPTREECTVNRSGSNTPLQALVLLNDPTFVEAARVFAERTMASAGSGFDRRLNWAFDRALDRRPGNEEQQILAKLYQTSLERFRAAPGEARIFVSVGEAPLAQKQDVVELAAMTTVTRAILNLHETITRN
jgi:uncharacterized protein DUF1553/uncharacterized protein DUF1549/cytochrome c